MHLSTPEPSKKVNFILPFLPARPVGGAKIMFEYANHLASLNYSVVILYSVKRPHKKHRTPIWFRYLIQKNRRVRWFRIHPSIRQRVVREINNDTVPDAAATISTWWQMTYALADLSAAKGKKINLIQDYEIWTGQTEKVHASYALPVHHVVIAKHLSCWVEKLTGQKPIHIPNAIDTDRFRIQLPVEMRPRASVIMLYSEEERKGSVYGLTALDLVKRNIPDLQTTLFSVYPRPANLPAWIRFIQCPAKPEELYNESAIFISPSLGEGWALPPAEAMACGCAVVCTDIGGHHDYAEHEKTALLVSPKDPEGMAQAIERLIQKNDDRLQLVYRASENLKQFSWQVSTSKLVSLIGH